VTPSPVALTDLENLIRDHLGEYRFYSPQSWVSPATTATGQQIKDVVVVGAGQSGLALAYNLKLLGIRRIEVVDSHDEDRAGPWSSFARMKTLRTPKNVPGPECANPLLSFRMWFSAKYSRGEYEAIEFVALRDWCDYLSWFRRILDITPHANTQIVSIQWSAADACLRLVAEDGTEFFAKRVCLATGITAPGRWTAPTELVGGIPAGSYRYAWEDIPWEEFCDKDVAVIGAGASGFDNAAAALDAGCRSVSIFGRNPFPDRDLYFELWRGRDDAALFPDEAGSPPADLLDPLVAFNAHLEDEDRLAVLDALFANGRSPANAEYLSRVERLPDITVHEEMPVDRITHLGDSNRLAVRAKGEEFEFDKIVFATGVQAGLVHRPELADLYGRIRTWGDAVGPRRELPLGLQSYPKLGSGFQFLPKNPADSNLSHIYSLADIVHTTVGLQSVAHVTPTVARHIGISLWTAQHAETVPAISVERGLT
jgi:thioredoxin reductase